MKNILIYTHFYFPEIGAASVRMQYFVKALEEAGHRVKIVTPKPNYGSGSVYSDYESVFKKENVTYLPILLPKGKSKISRLISYLSYFWISIFYSLVTRFKYDIILTSSPPILTAFAAALVARIKRKKLLFDIRDIWPDIGVELGILNNRASVSGLKKIEKFLYNSASKIAVTATGDKNNLLSKGVAEDKIELIFNGADTDLFKPISNMEKSDIRRQYNLPAEKKIFTYFGSFNFGMNDIDTLGDMLAKLSSADYHFLAIGNGLKRDELKMKINPNLTSTFIDSMPSEKIAQLLAASDISIIPRKKIAHDTGGNIPVKCFESWACGLPVLLSTIPGTDLEKIFNECKGGLLVEPGDSQKLLEGLTFISKTEFDSEATRKYTVENFDRNKQSEKIIHIINGL